MNALQPAARPFDGMLVKRFNEPGPYYSSYPTLSQWTEPLQDAAYREALIEFFKAEPDAPIYFYVHIPFCAKLCWYCICNIQISNNRERIQRFTDVLCKEIDQLKAFLDANRIRMNVREIHLGGGTPSHLDNDQVSQLVARLGTIAEIDKLDEFAMEIDPRTCDKDKLRHYASLGVDRISFGVQDFDTRVQAKINRIQPFELVRDLLSLETRKLFRGVNFDLLYGLPMQTRETLRRTVELTKELAPDRITFIRYAHVPDVRKHMKMINAEELPPVEHMPHMFRESAETLVAAGYDWVGIDNFAKPSDDLAKAARAKANGRNFGGSSPGRADNIVGVGPTSTHVFGRWYFQSVYDAQDYAKAVEEGHFPILRGFKMSPDDLLRREVIFGLQCHQEVDLAKIGARHGVDWKSYFAREIEGLAPYIADGMVALNDSRIELTTLGRFFVRHVCRLFDAFLADGREYRIHGP